MTKYLDQAIYEDMVNDISIKEGGHHLLGKLPFQL